MTRNIMNHDDATAHIPAILKIPAAFVEGVKHIVFDTAIDERDLKLRGELIGRILTGLDVQKQQAQENETSNHWSSWSNSEDERRVAVQPKLESLCWALTRAVLHAELRQRGWIDAKISPWRVGFDLSEASVTINQAENFRLAHDRGWINEEAGRRSIGAKSTDAMSPEEKVRWAGEKLKDPYLALYGLDGKDGIKIDWSKVSATKQPPGPQPPGQGGKAGPGVGSPGSPSSRDSDAPKSKEPS
jgi:hypothetical protein